MEPKTIKIQVSDSIGSVSAISLEPDNMTAMMVLAHGAGAGLNHRFMEALASALASHGIGTLRYNFPYMENGKSRPDTAPVAEKTVAKAMAITSEMFSGVPIFVGGKSFGGRMSSQYLSKATPDFAKGIVFFGFPLHPAGAPSVSRAEHLAAVKLPMLFLQGTRDALADLILLQEVCANLPTATLATFAGADHSFKVGKKELVPELASAADRWMQTLA